MAQMKLSGTDLIDAFKEMTLLELSEFVKEFENVFGVTAATAVVPVPGPAVTPADEEPAEEQSEFDLVLESTGKQKIQVIKEVRAITKLGLAEAKNLVDSAPVCLLEKVSKDVVEKTKDLLIAAGAEVTVKLWTSVTRCAQSGAVVARGAQLGQTAGVIGAVRT